MKYNKIIILLCLLIFIAMLSNKVEYFNNPQLFLVKLAYQGNYQIYNLYDSSYRYKSYCDFIKDFIVILNDKNNNFTMMNFTEYTQKIKNFALLNKILITKNNQNIRCEREGFYKVKYFIPTIDANYNTDGYYIFLYVLFLKYKFNYNISQINNKLKENSLDITVLDTSGNIFVKMRNIIFSKEVCDPQMIAEIQKSNIIMNDLDKRIERRNPFKNVPKVIELKLINDKFKLFDIQNEFYPKLSYDVEKMNDYINTYDFKRRVFINATNSLSNMYITKKLNNIFTLLKLQNELIKAKKQFKLQFNNHLNCNEILCDKNIEFNSSRLFTEKMFKCGNGRIIINFKNNPYEVNNTIDINKLHYELCPSSINGNIVGKMDYFNENCSIGDIEPEYIFSKDTSYTKLPFSYWLFSNN